MMVLSALALAALLLPSAANAALTRADLDPISAAPMAGAAVPADARFLDESGHWTTLASALGGKPAVLILADYTCHTLCGPVLEFAAAGLAGSGLRPGVDYRLVLLGLDPADGLDAARSMRSSHLAADDPIASAASFLTGTEKSVRETATALGYHYTYDAEHSQFAHPAAVYVVDANRAVTRVLSGLGLSSDDFRLALIEAGHGSVGRFADRIQALCYGYDPVLGIYTKRITLFLELATGGMLLLLTAAILAMLGFERSGGRGATVKQRRS